MFKINNKPKIIFENILNINDDIIKHRKSKSINNNLLINRLNIKNTKTYNINPQKNLINNSNIIYYKTKMFDFDNNTILKENEKNDSLMTTNNISKTKEHLIKKKILKKRKSIPFKSKKNLKRYSIISNLSKINQNEDFSLSKLIDTKDDNFSLNTNKDNISIFRTSKAGLINKNLTQDINSSFNINIDSLYIKYPIYYWLKEINLLTYYNIFIENNIYDFDKLIEKLKKGSFCLKKEDFQNIGIYIPGHIYRIIIKLEIDSGSIKEEIYNLLLNHINIFTIFANSTEEINDSIYYCTGCWEQKSKKKYCNKNIIGENVLELENWLNNLGLIKYRNNFISNGFDLLPYFILQMFSSFPIDENIVKEELDIHNEIDVDMILLQLNKEVKYILSKLKVKDKKNKKNLSIKSKETYQKKFINYPIQMNCQII